MSVAVSDKIITSRANGYVDFAIIIKECSDA